jgi:hypothetical protein
MRRKAVYMGEMVSSIQTSPLTPNRAIRGCIQHKKLKLKNEKMVRPINFGYSAPEEGKQKLFA